MDIDKAQRFASIQVGDKESTAVDMRFAQRDSINAPSHISTIVPWDSATKNRTSIDTNPGGGTEHVSTIEH